MIDQSIIAYAKSRAKVVSTYDGLGEGHRGLDHKYGENLYWSGSSTQWTPATTAGAATAAVKAWYDEISQYNFKKNVLPRH